MRILWILTTCSLFLCHPCRAETYESRLTSWYENLQSKLHSMIATGESSHSSKESAGSKVSAPLASFCDVDLHNNATIDCSCCSDNHEDSQYAKVALSYNSKIVNAKAFQEDPLDASTTAVGEVRASSLGRHTPEIVCFQGALHCRCQNQEGWKEAEPTCSRGSSCRNTVLGMNIQEDLSAPLDDLDDPAVRALRKRVSDLPSDYDMNEHNRRPQDLRLPDCSGDPSVPRISLGKSGFCQDASVTQCDTFYTKMGDTFAHCKVENAPKVCHARVLTESQLREQTLQVEQYVLQTAYSPETGWDLQVQPDGTGRLLSIPEDVAAEEVLKQLADNLQVQRV